MQPSDSQRLDALNRAMNQLLQNQDRLEQRLLKLERMVMPEPEPVLTPVPRPVPVPEAPSEPIAPAVRQTSLESKVGLTVVNRIGVVTLVLGIAFFFKWAVDNNWIGPAGRVVLGLIAGFATLAAGDFSWRKKQQIFAQGITATGVAIVYLSLYAAFEFYRLIPQSAAFLTMVATTVMAVALALRYNAFAIAALSFAAAYLTPLLLSTGEDHPWFLFGYLLLLNFAATELALRRGWRRLELISFAATALIYAGWLVDRGSKPEKRVVGTVAALAFCAQRWRTQTPMLFSLSQLSVGLALAFAWREGELPFLPLLLLLTVAGLAFSHLRLYQLTLATSFAGFWLSYLMHMGYGHVSRMEQFYGVSCGFLLFSVWSWWHLAMKRSAPTTVAMAVLALNGVFYFSGSYYLLKTVHAIWLGPLAALIAASYWAFGLYLQRRSDETAADDRPVLLALGIALAFLTLAIPIQFTGFTITIAWAIQAAAVSWIGYRLNSTRAILAAAFVFVLVLLRLLAVEAETLADAHTYSLLWNVRFLTFAASAVSLLLAAWWGAKIFPPLVLGAFFAGHAVMLGGLCLEIFGWVGRAAAPENHLSVETMAVSVLFAVYAVMLIGIGVAKRSTINRLSGLGLIGIVILKLYLFDVWQLSRPYQILAFVILGVLLLSTSFLYSHFRRLIESWWKDDQATS